MEVVVLDFGALTPKLLMKIFFFLKQATTSIETLFLFQPVDDLI